MQKVQFFWTCLLALLADKPCFCLVVDLAVGLTINLVIGRAELTGGEVAISVLG